MEEYSLVDALVAIVQKNEILTFNEARSTANMYRYFVHGSLIDSYGEGLLAIKELFSDLREDRNIDENDVWNQSLKIDRRRSSYDIVAEELCQLIKKFCNFDYFKTQCPELFRDYLIKLKNQQIQKDFNNVVDFFTFERFFNKRRFLILLGIIGYHSRHYHFFLTRSEYADINADYCSLLNSINSHQVDPMEIDIFVKEGRLGNIEKYNDVIDIYYLDLFSLIFKYLHEEMDVLCGLIDITCGRIDGIESVNLMYEKSNDYINDCYSKGTLKKKY